MKAKNSLKTKGFTLVELLTVVTIIVILAGMTVGALGWVQRKSAVEKARAQLKLLENGLEQYYADTGVYPEAKDSKGLAMYYALFGDGVGADGVRGTDDDGAIDGRPDKGATVYLSELDPRANSGMVEGAAGKAPTRLIDSFGNAWEYVGGDKYKSRRNNPDFDIYSKGPDGKGTSTKPGADDIKNW